jgi:hypothetical protein
MNDLSRTLLSPCISIADQGLQMWKHLHFAAIYYPMVQCNCHLASAPGHRVTEKRQLFPSKCRSGKWHGILCMVNYEALMLSNIYKHNYKILSLGYLYLSLSSYKKRTNLFRGSTINQLSQCCSDVFSLKITAST